MTPCDGYCIRPEELEARMSQFQHDVRTPLNAMMGYAQLMAMSEMPRDLVAQAEAIVHSGRDLLALVEHLQATAGGRAPDSSTGSRAAV